MAFVIVCNLKSPIYIYIYIYIQASFIRDAWAEDMENFFTI